jgi:hypothetical protein
MGIAPAVVILLILFYAPALTAQADARQPPRARVIVFVHGIHRQPRILETSCGSSTTRPPT